MTRSAGSTDEAQCSCGKFWSNLGAQGENTPRYTINKETKEVTDHVQIHIDKENAKLVA